MPTCTRLLSCTPSLSCTVGLPQPSAGSDGGSPLLSWWQPAQEGVLLVPLLPWQCAASSAADCSPCCPRCPVCSCQCEKEYHALFNSAILSLGSVLSRVHWGCFTLSSGADCCPVCSCQCEKEYHALFNSAILSSGSVLSRVHWGCFTLSLGADCCPVCSCQCEKEYHALFNSAILSLAVYSLESTGAASLSLWGLIAVLCVPVSARRSTTWVFPSASPALAGGSTSSLG